MRILVVLEWPTAMAHLKMAFNDKRPDFSGGRDSDHSLQPAWILDFLISKNQSTPKNTPSEICSLKSTGRAAERAKQAAEVFFTVSSQSNAIAQAATPQPSAWCSLPSFELLDSFAGQLLEVVRRDYPQAAGRLLVHIHRGN